MAPTHNSSAPSNKFAITAARYTRAIMFTMFNMETFFNVGLALLSTYITSKSVLDIRYKLDSFFMSLAIISPLMSSLKAAFSRRETASKSMATLKSACLAYYMSMRDWNRVPKGSMEPVGNNQTDMAREIHEVLQKLLQSVVGYMRNGLGNYESSTEVLLGHMSYRAWVNTLWRNKVNLDAIHVDHTDVEKGQMKEELDVLNQELNKCYEAMSELNMWNERALVYWGYDKPGDGSISSRSNSLVGGIVAAFEQLRLAREYRTPVMLRYGCRVLIYVYAIFMGPYFNNTCDTFEGYEIEKAKDAGMKHFRPPTCYVNYIGAALFFMSVTLLARVAKDVEYPFDKKGLDDLLFDSDQELEKFTKLPEDPEFKKRLLAVVPEPSLSKDKPDKKDKKDKKDNKKDKKEGDGDGDTKDKEVAVDGEKTDQDGEKDKSKKKDKAKKEKKEKEEDPEGNSAAEVPASVVVPPSDVTNSLRYRVI